MDLLHEIMNFFDGICQKKVFLEGEKVKCTYKAESISDTSEINIVLEEFGFRQISMKRFDYDNNYNYYCIGFENNELISIIEDFNMRFSNYESIRAMICRRLPNFTEAEIEACLTIIFCILYELNAFTITVEDSALMTDEQKAIFNIDIIYQYNSLFIPYIQHEVSVHEQGENFADALFFYQLFDYLYRSYYYEISPIEQIELCECQRTGNTIYGLKLKHKDCLLSEFFNEFCNDKLMTLLYKKAFGNKECYYECIRFIKIILSELENVVAKK